MADDPIQHVIVLMLENRSFDHMLGALTGLLNLDGLNDGHPRTNADSAGVIYPQDRHASPVLNFDPKHDLGDVSEQLTAGGPNQGFVRNFEHAFPGSLPADRAEVMLAHEDLPALHTLALNYLVCDHWFSSVPGPTWPNRFFVHSGTSLGWVSMPEGGPEINLHWYDQETLYDKLNKAEKRWRIYYGDIPQSLLLVHQLKPCNAANYRRLEYFAEDVSGDPVEFPDYCFIEPKYYPPGANDAHPTHDVRNGDNLIADVYNALRANEALWASSLLVILFDEHGGFYDHVTPPAARPPDGHQQEYAFDQFGVRVPAVLVSPHVTQRVDPTVSDHTSFLKYLAEKWGLCSLGERASCANSIGPLIQPYARTDTADGLGPNGPLPHTVLAPEPPNPGPLNSNQSALIAVAKLLESAASVEFEDLESAVRGKALTLDHDVTGALESVESFLSRARAKARVA